MKKNKISNQTNLFDIYCIKYKTNKNKILYITENNENTELIENSKKFNTLGQITKYIIKNNWQSWAKIHTITSNT